MPSADAAATFSQLPLPVSPCPPPTTAAATGVPLLHRSRTVASGRCPASVFSARGMTAPKPLEQLLLGAAPTLQLEGKYVHSRMVGGDKQRCRSKRQGGDASRSCAPSQGEGLGSLWHAKHSDHCSLGGCAGQEGRMLVESQHRQRTLVGSNL